MAKHTYGFAADTDPDEAVAAAVAQAREDGFIPENTAYSTEIEYRHDDRVPFNRPNQAPPEPELCVVVYGAN